MKRKSTEQKEIDAYRRGFIEAKRQMFRQIRRRFKHLNVVISDLNMSATFKSVRPFKSE